MNALIKRVYSLTCVADNIRPVSLPKRSDVIKTFAKEKAFLTGWGSTPDGSLENRKILKVDLKYCRYKAKYDAHEEQHDHH